MRIASFDVGIKNLAFCITEEEKICLWEIKDITPERGEDTCTSIVKLLDSIPELLDVDVIVIEKQPSRNNKMRIVEALLYSYFIIKGVSQTEIRVRKAVVYSAKHKLGKTSFKGKSCYRERKKLAVARCSKFISETEQEPDFIAQFQESKKKDDLSDCFLQAMSYIKSATLLQMSDTIVIEDEKIVCRKPSVSQEKKGYTKSNLKYLYKNLSESEFIKSKKIQVACNKWFTSIEKAIESIKL